MLAYLRDFLELVGVLAGDVLAHELGALELLATEWAQPLVLRELDAVRRDERLRLPGDDDQAQLNYSPKATSKHTCRGPCVRAPSPAPRVP